MYVADRETFEDVFCMECGRIADTETLNSIGLCEDCRPLDEQAIGELMEVLQRRYAVITTSKGQITLQDWEQEQTFHTFDDWEACRDWAREQEWD